MGKNSSKLMCGVRKKDSKASPDERPYEPSNSQNNHLQSTPERDTDGLLEEETHWDGNIHVNHTRSRSVSEPSWKSGDARYEIFSPTRNISGAFDFPSPIILNGTDFDAGLPVSSSAQAMTSYLQSQINTDFERSYVPLGDDEIPYIDSRPNSCYLPSTLSMLRLDQRKFVISPSQRSLAQSAACSSGSGLNQTIFNFDGCEDVQIGDKRVTNISIEKTKDKLDSLIVKSYFTEKQWKKATCLFQETRSFSEALEMLEKENAVVLIGRKGDGKTSIAKTIILSLRNKLIDMNDDEKVIIVEKEHPEKLLALISRDFDAHFLVLVDDAFGKSAVDSIKLDKWQRKAEDVWDALSCCERVKLVITLRKHIWNKAKPLLQDYELFCNRIDLTSSEMALQSQEKASILRAHLLHSQKDIPEELVDEVSMLNPPGFPQCCNMFSTISELYGQGAQFFRKPARYLEKLLQELHTSNPNLYMALALTLVFGGRFCIKYFSKDCLETKKYLYAKQAVDEVLECCSTEGKVTLGQLRKSFETLLDVYFEIDDSESFYRFNHDSIEEAVARHFGERYPEVLINCSRLKSLQQWLCTREEDRDVHVVFLKPAQYFNLFKRLNKELHKDNAATVFTLLPARDENFVEKWVKSLYNSSVYDVLEQIGPKLLIHASRNGVKLFVEFLLSRPWQCWTLPFEELSEAVKGASCGGHADVLQILLKLSPSQQALTEAFEEVLEVGHVSSVRCLLTHSPELLNSQFYEKFECPQRNSEPFPVSQTKGPWKNCLHLAAYHGCVDIVDFLLSEKAMDPGSTDIHAKTALHHAAESGYASVVAALLQTSVVLDMLDAKDRYSKTPLHYAAAEGHDDVVKQLVEAGANLSAEDEDGHIPCNLAEKNGYLSLTKILAV